MPTCFCRCSEWCWIINFWVKDVIEFWDIHSNSRGSELEKNNCTYVESHTSQIVSDSHWVTLSSYMCLESQWVTYSCWVTLWVYILTLDNQAFISRRTIFYPFNFMDFVMNLKCSNCIPLASVQVHSTSWQEIGEGVSFFYTYIMAL